MSINTGFTSINIRYTLRPTSRRAGLCPELASGQAASGLAAARLGGAAEEFGGGGPERGGRRIRDARGSPAGAQRAGNPLRERAGRVAAGKDLERPPHVHLGQGGQ